MKKVSKEMMNRLNYIKEHKLEYGTRPLSFLNDVEGDGCIEISEWYWGQVNLADAQFKLIEHVFGDTPQFEEEKPKKYVVQIKNENVQFSYLKVFDSFFDMTQFKNDATRFDTREEAEKWTNPQTEVIEVDE